MKKATREQSKEHNKRLILNTIYIQSDISRAEIARMTKLTRATVSSIVSELIDDGLVAEIGQGISVGGKRPILLKVLGDSRQLIGIDLADNEFRGGLVDLNGAIVNKIINGIFKFINEGINSVIKNQVLFKLQRWKCI